MSKARTTLLFVTLALTVVLGVQAGTGVAAAQHKEAREVGEPGVAARAWAVADLGSGEYLAGEDASRELPIASTTKIMAALVVLEEADLDEEVKVSKNAAGFATPAYSNVGLLQGDTVSGRELLMATLISSGDDAAYALAEHVGGGGETGVNRFVEEMNDRARASGLRHTHFENPVGFDAREHYSSARDLAMMARLAMRNPEFRKIVSTEYATIHTPYRKIPLASTNELLFTYGPATGIKTGTTPASGESLVSSASRGTSRMFAWYSTLEKTASRPHCGLCDTVSSLTTAWTLWSRANVTPASTCPTGERRPWISWRGAAWTASWTRAPTWSVRSTW
jgi:D-alanyl-D-alanine carboxypeptidase